MHPAVVHQDSREWTEHLAQVEWVMLDQSHGAGSQGGAVGGAGGQKPGPEWPIWLVDLIPNQGSNLGRGSESMESQPLRHHGIPSKYVFSSLNMLNSLYNIEFSGFNTSLF